MTIVDTIRDHDSRDRSYYGRCLLFAELPAPCTSCESSEACGALVPPCSPPRADVAQRLAALLARSLAAASLAGLLPRVTSVAALATALRPPDDPAAFVASVVFAASVAASASSLQSRMLPSSLASSQVRSCGR